MKVTIEEMVETALELLYAHSTTPWSATAYWDEWSRKKPREAMRRALLGVIEKHVRPLLWEAYRDGFRDRMQGNNADSTSSADRILADLTANPPAPEKERT